MERYWKAVCCALLKSRCVRRGFKNNIKAEMEDGSFQVGTLRREAEQLLRVPWCCRTVSFQKSLLCAIKAAGVVSEHWETLLTRGVWVCLAAE